ncbi:caffeic acid 3-O-methyltransferase [Selaginella moellendorffii]|uniref:caffeic acid 3-O-methyltransferase n=1 Tax=Selaginella moellendorffii TaxID=88036 RepID=UPI000D1C6A26|nr:caffeic acid 3-O-methyltransferase [Selaginella moellendorffii]|eukprot:XP_002965284.2 caffeic acid 3-O-methyltransferase [Selaginella moellendorffii]
MGSLVLQDDDRLRIMEFGTMCGIPSALNAVIKLGIPDILSSSQDAPLSSAEIIAQIPACGSSGSGANLDRILRVLSSIGVFQESLHDGGIRKYGVTPLCRYLVTNPSNGGLPLSSWVIVNQDVVFMKTWEFLYQSVTTGADPFTAAHGKPLFDLTADNPRFRGIFDSAMSDNSNAYMRLIVEAYDGFQGVRTLVDVGGGIGNSLRVILGRHKGIKGINFDLPHVISKAPDFPGVEHVSGDMFDKVPQGDVIFMKWILHDWKDEACITLLKNCYESLPSRGKVVVVDSILPSGTNHSFGSRFALNMDLLMLAYTGGKERTLEEFEALANAAGFAEVKVVITLDFLSVLEMHRSSGQPI